MQTQTLLLIIGAAILSLGVALFQYYYKAKYKTSRHPVFALLRFLTIFGLLLLLINPSYKQVTYYTEKPSLAVAVDNTVSIAHLGYDDQVREAVDRFRESEPLNEAFDIQYYRFGSELSSLDSLSFDEKQTNITSAIRSLEDIYGNDVAPVVLVSDGNQTFGEAYKYSTQNYPQQIYPLVAGDTLVYEDLALGQINVNRYAYINNKFPVEIFTSYTGDAELKTQLTVRSGGRIVTSQALTFSADKSSQVTNLLLPASTVGVRQYTVSLRPIATEKNVKNNAKNFAIEVIDQKTNVLIVSSITHPDVGMLKKSIESNRLRTVTFAKPAEATSTLNEYELIILYQPNTSFKSVYEAMERLGKNFMTITGSKTNWNALNSYQKAVSQEITGQDEQVQGVLNPNFSTFLLEDIGFSDLPPLETAFGDTQFNVESDIALTQRIGSLGTTNPLVATTEVDGRRGVYIFGEGLWRWRAQSFIDKRTFEDFDGFIENLVQYAASNKKKSRLNLDYESFYYGNESVKLYAQYFDKNYSFDARARLTITLVNKETKKRTQVPMLLKRTSYEVDLSNLDAGDYTFTVTVDDQGLARSGSFTIVPFEIEQQFLNAAVAPLRQVATQTEASLFSVTSSENLISQLLEDRRYTPIQKSTENIVPFIDWKWLLAILAILLAVEWFMRKYSGLT